MHHKLLSRSNVLQPSVCMWNMPLGVGLWSHDFELGIIFFNPFNLERNFNFFIY